MNLIIGDAEEFRNAATVVLYTQHATSFEAAGQPFGGSGVAQQLCEHGRVFLEDAGVEPEGEAFRDHDDVSVVPPEVRVPRFECIARGGSQQGRVVR